MADPRVQLGNGRRHSTGGGWLSLRLRLSAAFRLASVAGSGRGPRNALDGPAAGCSQRCWPRGCPRLPRLPRARADSERLGLERESEVLVAGEHLAPAAASGQSNRQAALTPALPTRD